THEKWLDLDRGVEDDTYRFLDLVKPLAEKLGPILIQLRPKFNYEEHVEALETYLDTLPENYKWAVEFRNLSWMKSDTLRILERYNAAYTIVDEPLLPPDTHITADFAYIRWHGHGANPWYNYEYSPSELESWVPKVKDTTKRAGEVYGYFNNHFSANAVKNASEILAMLEQETAEQMGAVTKILDHRQREAEQPQGLTLDAFAAAEEGLNIADQLMRFTNAPRLLRAEGIKDEELEITLNSGERVEADIRRYTIEIDRKAKTITHDCGDWRKGADRKRVCKHVAKLFLSLPEGQAEGLLSEIWRDIEGWRFLVS
ncbi:MAG: DUF72 domain-containing protein, partial [Candidatus Bathyarchaeota archaeon]